MFINFLYYFFALIVAIGAGYILFTSNIFYGILSLIGVTISFSALYFLQGATFIAIIQLIIHVGGMLVLLVATLLFIKPNSIVPKKTNKKASYTMVGIIMLAFLMTLVEYVSKLDNKRFIPYTSNTISTTTQDLGYQILGTYGLAFELVSIIMLVALIGVLHIISCKVNKNK